MEEEGARRRKFKGAGGAGNRGFLAGLNEDEEDEDEDEELMASKSAGVPSNISASAARKGNLSAGPVAAPGARSKRGPKGFELDMDGATLLGRRHKRTGTPGTRVAGLSSPLSGKPMGTPLVGARIGERVDPGSPMRIV